MPCPTHDGEQQLSTSGVSKDLWAEQSRLLGAAGSWPVSVPPRASGWPKGLTSTRRHRCHVGKKRYDENTDRNTKHHSILDVHLLTRGQEHTTDSSTHQTLQLVIISRQQLATDATASSCRKKTKKKKDKMQPGGEVSFVTVMHG